MSQRIHLNPNVPRQSPMMGGIGGGYAPDPISRPTETQRFSDNEMLANIQKWSSKVEDVIETYTQVSYVLVAVPELPRLGSGL